MRDNRFKVRVYQLPPRLTNGTCFGEGHQISFLNVDWFDATPEVSRERLVGLVRGKPYYDADQRFLVLADYPGLTFVVEPRR